ncbi:MAG: DHH family phosphoesterase [Clostridia bacterium]|nr:DHH family phosphoesterase [Clostridia bacterium]
MKKKNSKRFYIPEIKFYLLIILINTLIFFRYNLTIAVANTILLLFLAYYYWKSSYRRKLEWSEYVENLTENMNTAKKASVFNIPIPLVVIEEDGKISWYNSSFLNLLEPGQDILDKELHSLVPELLPKKIFEKDKLEIKKVYFREKYYQVLCYPSIIKSTNKSPKRIAVLYWINISDYVNLKERFEDEKPVVCFIQIDNYDEVLQNTEEMDKTTVLAEIDKRIAQWANMLKSSWKKYDKDEYIAVFQNYYLLQQQQKKFSILDDIRDIETSAKFPVTLSIGIGADGQNMAETAEYARTALDLALGRGGDQAVVKRKDKLMFYGGKTKEVEKRTKVKSRVIAHALRELINQSDKVFIMSHEMPDLDAIGSALGIYRAAKSLDKQAYIVLDRSKVMLIDKLISQIEEDEEYDDVFVSPQQAYEMINEQSLLAVVDTHRPSFTEYPPLLKKTERIFVVDHHRRSTESIENATLMYMEPYSSSTSELVTEILQYIVEKVKLTNIESLALLAGITVDTKNFSFKTGVRTFEAASFLRRAGADTTAVKMLFQDDLNTFIARAEVVKNAEVIEEGIVISVCPEDVENPSLIVAQAADELINIRGIKASFVLYGDEDGTIISARSLGDINVQLILEKLGGGGHLSIAGAQLKGIGIEQAKQRIRSLVLEYLKEEEKE